MALLVDSSDYMGKALGAPAQDKEGGAGTVAVELVQKPGRVALQTTFKAVPVATRKSGLKRLDHKPFFEIDGEQIKGSVH